MLFIFDSFFLHLFLFSLFPLRFGFCFLIFLFQQTHYQRRTGEIETKYTRNWYFHDLILLSSSLFFFFCFVFLNDKLWSLISNDWERKRINVTKSCAQGKNTTAARHTFDDTEPTAQCLKCAKRQRCCTYAEHAVQTSGVRRCCFRFRFSHQCASDRRCDAEPANVMSHVAPRCRATSIRTSDTLSKSMWIGNVMRRTKTISEKINHIDFW